jgi:hypothetical protein
MSNRKKANRFVAPESLSAEALEEKNTFNALIEEAVQFTIERENRLIQSVINQANEGGKHGVVIIRSRSGKILLCEVSDQVPFGELHEYRKNEEE